MPKQHDPGGKVRLSLARDVKSKAIFGGPGDCYRYRLSRTWEAGKPHAMFVMMNPSTADLLVDDSTVAKCGRYARAWGYGGIYVGNTFAYRATDKRHLRLVEDPIGPDNDRHLVAMAKVADVVVFAYGQPGHSSLEGRGLHVARLLVKKAGITPHILKLSKAGIPVHPLYLLESLEPVVWRCLQVSRCAEDVLRRATVASRGDSVIRAQDETAGRVPTLKAVVNPRHLPRDRTHGREC